MNPKIKTKQISSNLNYKFEVVVEEDKSEAVHRVSMSKDFYESLDTGVEPWRVIEESFRFLLSKEPKEMIMKEFDVTVISNYFPEYEEELKKSIWLLW